MESRSALRSGLQPKKRKTCVTVIVLAVIIGCILLAYKAFGDKPKDPLKKVFIIFRHGERTPTETFPNDPHVNYPWPGGWGSLTTRGMSQMYRLGQWVRQEFGWITSNKFDPTSTIVNSSYADRCIASTQALLAGLYPPSDKDFFVAGLPWRPIPVHYMPKSMEQILVVTKFCPKLKQALAEAYVNESLSSDAELKSYYEELTRITGQNVTNITAVEFLYNTLEIEEMNNLELLPDIKPYYNARMREIAARSYTLFTSNTLQRRLRGGPLLKHILDKMDDGKDEEKLFLYGVHDLGIVNALRAMGFTNELFKLDFGVTLIYELRVPKENTSHVVRVSMLNSTEMTEPHELKIPGCDDPCEPKKLKKLWKDVIPEDWEQECNS